MKRAICFLSFFFLAASTSFGQEPATTSSGKKVILYPDGTWQYASEGLKQLSPAPAPQPASSPASYDFRETNWGMTRAQVKSAESAKFAREESEVLAYTTTVANLETVLGYIFAEDKLIRTRYAFAQSRANMNDYLRDHQNIKKQLTQRYGAPRSDETVWRNDVFKDDESRWGRAISLGHLAYATTWETPTTRIYLLLFGGNNEINLWTEYASKALAHLEEKTAAKKKGAEF